MNFNAWDTVVRELQDMSTQAQQAADWARHRDITETLRLLQKLWQDKEAK